MRLRGIQVLILTGLCSLTALGCGILFGSVEIPLLEIAKSLFFPSESLSARIIWELRIPRVAIAFTVGGLLAVAGMMMQTLLQNPLADPYVLGTSGGATVAVLCGFLLGMPVSLHATLAILGATVSTLFLFLIAGFHGRRETLILTGIILTTGWGALLTFLLTTAPHGDLPGMLFWLVGDLGHNPSFQLPLLVLIMITILAVLIAKPMNLLLLGDEHAQTLGVPVTHLRLLLLILSVIATSVAVAAAGPIGFVGLVTPHLLRLMMESNHLWLIPSTVLLGGSLVTLADLAARMLIAPRELPVGVFTAMIGVPIFLLLLKKQVRSQ